jgi:cytochrome c-type biogenesis protein
MSLKLGVLEEVRVVVYDAQLTLSSNLAGVVLHPSLFGCLLMIGAGILSSLSPCSIGVLPLTVTYLRGSPELIQSKESVFPRAFFYAVGVSSSLTSLGLVSSLTGRAFNSIAGIPSSLPQLGGLLGAALTYYLGLSLLQLVPPVSYSFGSLMEWRRRLQLPSEAEAFLLGFSGGLFLSPCSSPVLAALLAGLAGAAARETESPSFLGALYLFMYSLGFVFPTVAAVTGSLQVTRLVGAEWINTCLGCTLVSGGTYFVLDTMARLAALQGG